MHTARVGKTPGATASVNLYAVKGRKSRRREMDLLGFADLPGFGYAKLSKSVKESVEAAAERYLARRKELVLGILLVDVRRVPSEDDRAVLAALYDMGVPLLVVATKVDKLKANALPKAVEGVRVNLGLPEGQPLCVSSVSGEGIKEVWKILLDACEEKVEEWRGDEEEDYDDNNGAGSGTTADDYLSDVSKRRMAENEQMQADANAAMKLKSLKKKARKMQKDGRV